MSNENHADILLRQASGLPPVSGRRVVRACVIGWPLGHSRSPAIYNHWFEQYGIDGHYEPNPIAPDTFESVAARLGETYNGFSVTIPYKEKILPFCASVDDTARAIGAVNMVAIDDDGRLHGHNTDAYGFAENLRREAPGFNWRSCPALVLGAGGAARAVVYALKSGGAPDIVIANRSRARADILAAQFGTRAIDWDDVQAELPRAHLLVNTTSLGMTGQPPLNLALDALPDSAIVYDIVYKPLMTPLLQAARARNLAVVTGIGMLLHQAVPAFEAWTGVRPAIDDTLVAKMLEPPS